MQIARVNYSGRDFKFSREQKKINLKFSTAQAIFLHFVECPAKCFGFRGCVSRFARAQTSAERRRRVKIDISGWFMTRLTVFRVPSIRHHLTQRSSGSNIPTFPHACCSANVFYTECKQSQNKISANPSGLTYSVLQSPYAIHINWIKWNYCKAFILVSRRRCLPAMAHRCAQMHKN